MKNRNSFGTTTFDMTVATSHGKNSFFCMAIRTWNDVQKQMEGVLLHAFSLVKLKSLLIKFYLNICKNFFSFQIY